MKVILRNANLVFEKSRVLKPVNVLTGKKIELSNNTPSIVDSVAYNVYVYSIADVAKLNITTKLGGDYQYISAYISQFANKTIGFAGVLQSGTINIQNADTYVADVLYVGCTNDSIPSVIAQEFTNETFEDVDIDTTYESYLLDANGDRTSNQYYNVYSYDVTDIDKVSVRTFLNTIGICAVCVKKDDAKVAVISNTDSSTSGAWYLVDTSNADTIEVACNKRFVPTVALEQ